MIEIELFGQKMTFETEETLFSPRHPDYGTLAMLSQIDPHISGKMLDLGCGWGLVGITFSKLIGSENVVMCDVNPSAVKQSSANAELNGVSPKILVSDALNNIADHDFSLILSNPPYQTDFAVPKKFIEQSYRHLAIGGKLMMVTKRRDWYKNKLASVFGGVKISEVDGYFVFTVEKRERVIKEKQTPTLSKKLQHKMKNKI